MILVPFPWVSNKTEVKMHILTLYVRTGAWPRGDLIRDVLRRLQ